MRILTIERSPPAWAECSIPAQGFASEEFEGEDVIRGIVEANGLPGQIPTRGDS